MKLKPEQLAEIRERINACDRAGLTILNDAPSVSRSGILAYYESAHADRKELDTYITALEAEKADLRGWIQHKPNCEKGKRTDFYMISPCTCGLDELLSKQEQE